MVRSHFVAALSVGLLALAAAPAHASELVLDRAGGFVVPAEVNGARLRLRVDPAATGMVMINARAAARSGLKPSQFKLWNASVGPIKIAGQGQLAAARFAGEAALFLRFLWFDRDVSQEADGLISIAALPYDRVVMKLAPPAPSERSIEVPVLYREEIGLFHAFSPLAKPIPLQFSTLFPHSLATAAAGAQVAVPFKGGWAGPEGRSPIRFGVSRPTRPMALRKPILIGGLPVDRLLVRTSDNRAGYSLPADEDSEEIVVTGGSKQPAKSNIVLGQDLLQACSSIAFDRAAMKLVLSCRVPTPVPAMAAAPANPPTP